MMSICAIDDVIGQRTPFLFHDMYYNHYMKDDVNIMMSLGRENQFRFITSTC